MKVIVTMKNPDSVGDAIEEAAKALAEQVTGIDEDERENVLEGKREKVKEVFKKWFEYEEYLRVEIDTDTGTATVLAA